MKSPRSGLYYARWKNGEVDLVSLHGNRTTAWAAEIKWSDRAVDHPADLAPLLDYCARRNCGEAVVTTRSSSGTFTAPNRVQVDFVPSALYCHTIGYNLIRGRRLPG